MHTRSITGTHTQATPVAYLTIYFGFIHNIISHCIYCIHFSFGLFPLDDRLQLSLSHYSISQGSMHRFMSHSIDPEEIISVNSNRKREVWVSHLLLNQQNINRHWGSAPWSAHHPRSIAVSRQSDTASEQISYKSVLHEPPCWTKRHKIS